MIYYDTMHMNDERIDKIYRFLFEYQKPEIKHRTYIEVKTLFETLDLPAMYFLFSLISEKLPHRAQLFFMGEDFLGKRDAVLEVMQSKVEQL